MKCISSMMIGVAAGIAVGASAMAAANCPKVKRACRTAQRKMMFYAKKMGM